MSALDLSDPLVLEMADRNHIPEEHTVRAPGRPVVRWWVVCRQCGQPWPCQVRRQITELQRDGEQRPAPWPPRTDVKAAQQQG